MRLESLFPRLGRLPAAPLGGLALAVFFAYLFVVLLGVASHEPWFDEAQSWLLARDASIGQMLLLYLRYEGHPPLWYALLSAPAKLGFPYKTANMLSALSMAVGVLLFLRLPRVPWPIRIVVPFGFFIVYQYAVLARAYALFLPVLMAIAHIYPRRRERVLVFTGLLVVLSNISLHGLAMAWAFAALYALELSTEVRAGRGLSADESWRHRVASLVFLLSTATLLVVLWPPGDLLIAGELSVERSFFLFQFVVKKSILPMLARSFWLSIPLALFFLAWFWRQRLLLTFAALMLAVQAITSLYTNYWHEGIFFLVFLFVFTLSLRLPAPSTWRWAAILLALAVFLQHGSWGAKTLAFDIEEPYSASYEAASFIKTNQLHERQLYGIGFTCLALQPYFEQRLLDNYRTDGDFTFWDWSTSNPFFHPSSQVKTKAMHAAFEKVLAEQPEYLIIGYKFYRDRFYEQWMAERGDYRRIRRFDGALYWKHSRIEVESYELYARTR